MTDSEKLDDIEKHLRRVEVNSYIHVAIVVIGFLGIVSIADLLQKIKLKK